MNTNRPAERTGRIVVFSGMDGAGKTTQIENLEGYLRAQEIGSKRAWARGGYTPFFQALKLLARRVAGRRLPSAGDSPQRKKAMARPRVARPWLRIAILDLMLFWGVHLRLQRMLGRVVICDRYIDDTRLDFRRNFPMIAFERMVLWRMLEWVTPTPDAAFLLWVPVDESMRRSREKAEPFADDEETLAWRLRAYMDDSVFPPERYMRLDCRRSVSEISEEIIGTVAEKLGIDGHGNGC